MTVDMRYICETANPLNIIAYGYTLAAGGLGAFDTSKYSEVQAELPPNAVMVQPATSAPASTETPAQPTTPSTQALTDQVAALQAQLAALMAQLSGKGLLGK